jgi:hypothetical protein
LWNYAKCVRAEREIFAEDFDYMVEFSLRQRMGRNLNDGAMGAGRR